MLPPSAKIDKLIIRSSPKTETQIPIQISATSCSPDIPIQPILQLHHALPRNPNPKRPANPTLLPHIPPVITIHLVLKNQRITNPAQLVNKIQVLLKN